MLVLTVPKYVINRIPWANSVDPDQTDPKDLSDQGLYCYPLSL